VTCMFAANLGFLNFLNSSFGLDFGDFKLKARGGVPDDDWEMCDCSDVWAHEWNLRESAYIWVPANLDGAPDCVWTLGEGYVSTPSAGGNTGLYIYAPYSSLGGAITRIEVGYSASNIYGGTHQIYCNDVTNSSGAGSVGITGGELLAGEHDLVMPVSYMPIKTGILIVMNTFPVAGGQTFKFNRVRIVGTGTDLFA